MLIVQARLYAYSAGTLECIPTTFIPHACTSYINCHMRVHVVISFSLIYIYTCIDSRMHAPMHLLTHMHARMHLLTPSMSSPNNGLQWRQNEMSRFRLPPTTIPFPVFSLCSKVQRVIRLDSDVCKIRTF
jgi:hypothetical protein